MLWFRSTSRAERSSRAARRFLSAILLLCGAGCAGSRVQPVSFLERDVRYHPDPQDPDVLIYRNPAADLTAYSKFLIDPVLIYSNEAHGLAPEEERALAQSFRETLASALSDPYQVVTSTGPGVLRIRTAIQDIQPAHVQLDEDRFLVLRLDTVLARVAMELDAVDSVSGERVVDLVHRLRDRRFFDKEKRNRLINMRQALDIWTRSLRKRFDDARRGQASRVSGGAP